MDKETDYRSSIEIKEILHLQQDMFDALFEVLGLSQEQVDTFTDLCNKKLQDRIDKEKQVKEIFYELLSQKENVSLHT